MIKISYLDSDLTNVASNIFKVTTTQDNKSMYTFTTQSYLVTFIDGNITFSNVASNPKKHKLRNFFKKQSNISKEIDSSTVNPISISFDSIDNKSIEISSDKLVFQEIYKNIDLKIIPITKGLMGEFILVHTSNLSDIKINLSDYNRFSIDEDGNLYLDFTNFIFKLNAPIYNNRTYKFIMEGNSAKLDIPEFFNKMNEDNNNNLKIDEVLDTDINLASEVSMLQVEDIPKDVKILAAPPEPIYPVAERLLLIKVEKAKFGYLFSKADNVLCCPNIGVINDLYIREEINYRDYPLEVQCSDSTTKTINAKIPYKDIIYKPYISYSVSIYDFEESTTTPTLPLTTCYDGLNIYALQDDSFIGDEVPICSGINDIPLKPVDYEVVLDATCELLPDTTLTNYFVYLVTVQIGITKAPPINNQVDQNTLEDLNVALGRDPGSTEPITRGDLQTITTLDLSNSGQSGLSVLVYTPNLMSLTINSAGVTDISSLQATPNLQTLIMPDNSLNDISVFKYLPALTTVNVSGNQISDLSPISTLTLLTYLDVSSNNVLSLLPLASITTLNTLIVSSNNINSLDGLEALTNLTYLDASNNGIRDLTPIIALTKLTKLFISKPSTTTFEVNTLSNEGKITDISILEYFTELVQLDLSGNAITDITPLANLSKLTDINITNQDIVIETPIQPDIDGEYVLSIAFLRDIDGLPPVIITISDEGHCQNPDSAMCTNIIWSSSKQGKTVWFTFSSDLVPFTGKVSVTLASIN